MALSDPLTSFQLHPDCPHRDPVLHHAGPRCRQMGEEAAAHRVPGKRRERKCLQCISCFNSLLRPYFVRSGSCWRYVHRCRLCPRGLLDGDCFLSRWQIRSLGRLCTRLPLHSRTLSDHHQGSYICHINVAGVENENWQIIFGLYCLARSVRRMCAAESARVRSIGRTGSKLRGDPPPFWPKKVDPPTLSSRLT
jgi:hypothetical protein